MRKSTSLFTPYQVRIKSVPSPLGEVVEKRLKRSCKNPNKHLVRTLTKTTLRSPVFRKLFSSTTNPCQKWSFWCTLRRTAPICT